MPENPHSCTSKGRWMGSHRGGTERTETVSLLTALWPLQWSQVYRKPRAASKMAPTTPSRQPQMCPWTQATGQQWNWSLRPHLSGNWGTHDPGACPPASAAAEPLNVNKTGYGRGACTILALPSLSPSLFSKTCVSGGPRCKERALHLRDNRGSGRSKSPMTPVSYSS